MNTVPNYRSAYHLIDMMLTPVGWRKYKCGEMKHEHYSLHFHSFGKLRWWQKQAFIESGNGSVIYPITQDQAAYIIVHSPESFEQAMVWLRNYWPKHKFVPVELEG